MPVAPRLPGASSFFVAGHRRDRDIQGKNDRYGSVPREPLGPGRLRQRRGGAGALTSQVSSAMHCLIPDGRDPSRGLKSGRSGPSVFTDRPTSPGLLPFVTAMTWQNVTMA